MNTYGYVGGNPVGFVDPLGLMDFTGGMVNVPVNTGQASSAANQGGAGSVTTTNVTIGAANYGASGADAVSLSSLVVTALQPKAAIISSKIGLGADFTSILLNLYAGNYDKSKMGVIEVIVTETIEKQATNKLKAAKCAAEIKEFFEPLIKSGVAMSTIPYKLIDTANDVSDEE